MFCGRWLLAGLQGSIFADFDRFWGPLGMPFGIKMGSENEVRKKSEKGWFEEARHRGVWVPERARIQQPEASRWPLAASSQQDGRWQPAVSS